MYLCTRKIEAYAEISAKITYTHYLINKFISKNDESLRDSFHLNSRFV